VPVQCICSRCGKPVRRQPAKLYKRAYCSRDCQFLDQPQKVAGADWPCNDCGLLKPLTREHWIPSTDLKRHSSGFLSICRACRSERKRQFHQHDKLRCLTAYGGDPPRCACCDERILGFLTLDHVNDDGGEHRKRVNGGNFQGGAVMYGWLRRHGYPTDLGIRVLCFNCNAGRHWNHGICPHLTA